MATATASQTAPKWTQEDIVLAIKVIKEAGEYTGNFIYRFGMAAKEYGYENYGHLPKGVKSYISSLGGRAKKKHK